MLAEPAAVTRATLLGLAAEIGATLCRDALWHDGRALWLGDEVVPIDGEFETVHQACGGALYGGTAGIGWFLAHLSRALGDRDAAATARGALRHALAWAAATPDPSLHAGRAGVGWAALDAALALDDGELAHEGLRTLLVALEAPAPAELPAEVIGGHAGIVLGGLAALAPARAAGLPCEDLESALEPHGRAILALARRSSTGWTWPDAEGLELCGLAHGTSGPALACAELWAATGDEAYREAALAGARAERAWLEPTRGWPDLREYSRADLDAGERPDAPPFWCHGTVGVTLARLRAARLTGDDALLADATVGLSCAESAVAGLARAVPGSYAANFSLCHGAAGLMELFTVAAHELDDAAWLARAAAVAALGRAHREAGVPWRCGVADGFEAPGLMLGLAGTGAALLHAADPGGMPTPLLLGGGAA
ncbi:lanthionine synthetase LanC family protein [Demequina iriomotensis]|uniref:lanthionine synthetase LanC family protein n=1 Tax=Demequina iriomotensis TaxID=1536641 RepID=UPI0007858695|nr:lanthionine synthetase LanC family protein [Demequina iriomotensis]